MQVKIDILRAGVHSFLSKNKYFRCQNRKVKSTFTMSWKNPKKNTKNEKD
jgi:hypothetical protein